MVSPICQRLHLHEMVAFQSHLYQYILRCSSNYSAYFPSHHNNSVPIFAVMPKKLPVIFPEVSSSRDGSLQVKGHKGPVSPAFPSAPNQASKMSNHPVTHYTPVFRKALGFKVLPTHMTGQSRRICKEGTHRGHREHGQWWAKHNRTWEDFLLQARMCRGTHSFCVSTNPFLNSGLEFCLVGEKMAQATTAFRDPQPAGTGLSWLQSYCQGLSAFPIPPPHSS